MKKLKMLEISSLDFSDDELYDDELADYKLSDDWLADYGLSDDVLADELDNLHTGLEWHGDPSNFVLSNELRVINWLGYPLESLPTNFQPFNLIELIMPHSCMKQLWDGRKVRFWLMQMYIFFFLLLFFILCVLSNYLLVFYNRVFPN